MVGAVIVHNNRIISEGYTQDFGGHHAEVMALNGLSKEDKQVLSKSTLYVSLEPCCFKGKTGACTSAVIASGIKKVGVISLDPHPKVNGKGIQILKSEGIEVFFAEEKHAAEEIFLNRSFRKFQTKQLPFISLKWAENEDGIMGLSDERLLITGPSSALYSHQLRALHQAILIGANCLRTDDPLLTTRFAIGPDPTPMVLSSMEETTFRNFKLGKRKEAILLRPASSTEMLKENLWTVDLKNLSTSLGTVLAYYNLQSLLVEGGKQTLDLFLQEQLFDEIHLGKADKHISQKKAIKAPSLPKGVKTLFVQELGEDVWKQIIKA